MLEEGVSIGITPERRTSIEEEKRSIAAFSNGEEIVAFMRRKFDAVNQNLLCQKALTMQEQAMQLILQRYRTTLQDVFVDTAVQILSQAEKHHAEALLEMYRDIRNPYAKSMACMVFGIQHLEHAAPLLYEEYERMKREYTKESLCQGPPTWPACAVRQSINCRNAPCKLTTADAKGNRLWKTYGTIQSAVHSRCLKICYCATLIA